MTKTQHLPSYAKGMIANELYDIGAYTDYIRKLDEGCRCSPYFRQKPKDSLITLFLKNPKTSSKERQ